MKVLVFALLTVASLSVRAEGLLGNACIDMQAYSTPASFSMESPVLELGTDDVYETREHMDGAFGLTCKDFKDAREVAEVVNIAVQPAVLVMMSTAARATIVAELAAMGVVVGTPAVVGVTVVGYFGVQTVKLLLKKPLEECARLEKEALKRELLEELEARYRVKGSANTTIQVTP